MPRSQRWWADLVLAGIAVAVALAAESHSYSWSDTRNWMPDLLTGWTLIACGILVRGRTRFLLAASGFAWFAGNFTSLALVLHRGPLAHLVLTYPNGAFGVFPAIAVAYLAAALGGAWLNEPATIALAITLVAGTTWRSLRSVGPRRREARYSLRAAGVLAAVLGLVATVNVTADTTSARETALLAYQAALCAVAVYLTYGALQRPWRPAVTDLVVELGETRGATVRDALAQALGDPTLEVAYRLEGRYVDAAGRPTSVPSDTTRHVTRILRDSEEVAVLMHDPAVLDDPGLADAVAAAAGLAAANARLQVDVRAQVTELEASRRRLLEAADAERRRLEERLREGATRRLAKLETRLAAAHAIAGANTVAAIEQAEDQRAKTAAELQELAAGLHPHELAGGGLTAAIAALAQRSPVPVEAVVLTKRLPEQLEATIFFICSEALANVVKHARASHAFIAIEEDLAGVRIEIGDDGVGGAQPRSITDRVAAVGGTLTVDSPAGGGTRLRAQIPR